MPVTQELRDHVNAWIYGNVEVDYTALTARFMRMVDNNGKGSKECWPFTGSTSNQGYGQFTIKGVMVYAHRVAYRIHVGPIPKGMTIDHDRTKGCSENRLCCNPDHLACVTRKMNSTRTRHMNVFT